MTLFLYCFFDCFALFFLYLAGKKKKKYEQSPNGTSDVFKFPIYKLFLVLSFLFLLVLILFRAESVGSDYEPNISLYLRIANDSVLTPDINWVGNAFIVLCKFFILFFKTHYLFFFQTIGFLSLGFLFKAIWKESKIPWLSLFLFISFCLYYQMFNQMRQMLALCICLYSLTFMKNRSWWKFFFIILFASIFHKTALILFPFYFLANMKINLKSMLLYFIAGLVIIFGFDFIIKILMNTYYGQVYFSSIFNVSYADNSMMNLIFRLLLNVVCLFFCKKTLKNDADNRFLYNLIMTCSILQIATVKTYVFGRLTTYFYAFYIFLIPEIVIANFKKNRNLILLIIVFLFTMYHFVYYFSSSGAIGCGYDVYQFIFQ